jgi:hypothetical protein
VNCPPKSVQIEYLRRVESRGGLNPNAPEKIVEALVGLPVSMAHLREAFISHVLMGLSLPNLRARFEDMAGIKPQDKTTAETIAELANLEDDEEIEETDAVYASKHWSPGDDKPTY